MDDSEPNSDMSDPEKRDSDFRGPDAPSESDRIESAASERLDQFIAREAEGNADGTDSSDSAETVSPDVAELADQMLQARTELRDMSPLGDSAVDQLIATAMAPKAGVSSSENDGETNVVDLRTRRRSPQRWMAAAAISVLVVGAGWFVKESGTYNSSESTEAASSDVGGGDATEELDTQSGEPSFEASEDPAESILADPALPELDEDVVEAAGSAAATEAETRSLQTVSPAMVKTVLFTVGDQLRAAITWTTSP